MGSERYKDSFIEICKKFTSLKFEVSCNYKLDKDTESVMINFPREVQVKFGCYKQFGTIQYMKYHLELRFYTIPLEKSGLDKVIDLYLNGREYRPNGENPYYLYKNISSNILNKMFTDLEKVYKESLGEVFDKLPETTIPDIAYRLPLRRI